MNPVQKAAIEKLDTLYEVMSVPFRLQNATSQDPAFADKFKELTHAAMIASIASVNGGDDVESATEQFSTALQELNAINVQKLFNMATEAAKVMIDIPAELLVKMLDPDNLPDDLPGDMSDNALKMKELAKTSGKNFVAAEALEIIGRFASLGVSMVGEEKFQEMNEAMLGGAPDFSSKEHRIAVIMVMCSVQAFKQASVSLEMVSATTAGVLEAAQLLRAMTTFNCLPNGPSIPKKIEAMFNMHANRVINFKLNEATEGCDCEDCQAMRAKQPAADFDESLVAGKAVFAGSPSIN